MDKALHGKVAVITGGSKGIGLAGALAFAQEGAHVVIAAREPEPIEASLHELRAAGAQALGVVCDVTDYGSVEGLFDKTVREYGGVDIVFACAGVNLQRDLLENCDISEWKQTIDINFMGVFHTARAAIPHLKNRGRGKIITVGSGRGRRGSENTSAYACSKAAQWMLVRCLAQELLPYNIAVNELVPGPVWTEMNSKWGERIDPLFLEGPEWVKTPGDVSPLLLFMATQPDNGPTGQYFALNRREI